MAANIQGIKRELVPKLRFRVENTAQLDRLEQVMGQVVVPVLSDKAAEPWQRRDTLKDMMRTVPGERVANRQLGNIVVTAIGQPYTELRQAIEGRVIKRTKENGIGQAIAIETRQNIIRAVAEHCVGMVVDADVMSLNMHPNGHVRRSVWYVPRLPADRTIQRDKKMRPMTTDEMLARSYRARQMTPITYQTYTSGEKIERERHLAEDAGAVPSLSLNDVLARAESPTELSLALGDVVLFPVEYKEGDIDTQWGIPHVVTRSHGDDTVFEAAKIMHDGNPGMLDEITTHELPARKVEGVSWDVPQILDAMSRYDRELPEPYIELYLAGQALLGSAEVQMAPIAA